MGFGGILASAKYKRLVIPRPNYEESGYGSGNFGLIKYADGSYSNNTYFIDYGVKQSDDDIGFTNKLETLIIQQKRGNTYTVPDTNTIGVLDLSEYKYLEYIQLGSVFLSADNITLPEIVVPLAQINDLDGIVTYGGENSIDGRLDLTPLNVNGMFGGIINFSNIFGVNDPILPINVTRPVTILNLRDNNTNADAVLDLSTWSRLGGSITIDRTVHSNITFPTFVELDAPIITKIDFTEGTGVDNTADKVFDLSAMHNLGGNIFLNHCEISTLTFNSNITNEITQVRLYNNTINTLDLSGFKNFNGILRVQGQGTGNLTSITLPPNATTTYTELDIGSNSSANIGVLDLTGVTFVDANLQLDDIGLTSFTVDNGQESNISTLNLTNNGGITGSLDFSAYQRTDGVSLSLGNLNVSSYDFDGTRIRGLNLTNNGTITELDLSTSIFLGGSFTISNNVNLATVNMFTPSNTFGRITQFNCRFVPNLTGTLDLSREDMIASAWMDCRDISNLSITDVNIIFPPSGSDVTPPSSFLALTNQYDGTVCDMSGFINHRDLRLQHFHRVKEIPFRTGGYLARGSRGTNLWLTNLYGLTTDLDINAFSALNCLGTDIQLTTNYFTTAQVNKILVDIASMETTHSYGSGSLNISNNSAPDGTSGGYDGLSAVTTLTNAGWSVTTESEIWNEFIIEVETTSGNETFTLPTQDIGAGANNFKVFWGDDEAERHNTTPDLSHEYSTAGTYEIRMMSLNNTDIPHFHFDDTGDKLKIKKVKQWGTNKPYTLNLNGCANLEVTATDIPDLILDTTLVDTFKDCTSLTSVNFDEWDISGVTDMTGFLNGTNISTADYDALLIAWEGGAVQSSVTADFGSSTYTLGGAADTARANLISNSSWVIIDGGGI